MLPENSIDAISRPRHSAVARRLRLRLAFGAKTRRGSLNIASKVIFRYYFLIR
jgi:hypothetical protein